MQSMAQPTNSPSNKGLGSVTRVGWVLDGDWARSRFEAGLQDAGRRPWLGVSPIGASRDQHSERRGSTDGSLATSVAD